MGERKKLKEGPCLREKLNCTNGTKPRWKRDQGLPKLTQEINAQSQNRRLGESARDACPRVGRGGDEKINQANTGGGLPVGGHLL